MICNILTDNAFFRDYCRGHDLRDPLWRDRPFRWLGDRVYRCIFGEGHWLLGYFPAAGVPLILLMGCAFGAFMGLLIDALKIPAFIITLAGMFFLRGVSYLVSEESIPPTIRFMTRSQVWHGKFTAAVA